MTASIPEMTTLPTSHPFEKFWSDTTGGKFQCPTWHLNTEITQKLGEKESQLEKLGYFLIYAHEFEFGLTEIRKRPDALWMKRRAALAKELNRPDIEQFTQQQVFCCDCYNDPRLKPMLEPRDGSKAPGQSYEDLPGTFEMQLKQARSHQQVANIDLFWKVVQEKLKTYDLRLLPMGTHTHGSLHRTGTNESVFDTGNTNDANLQVYKSAIEGLLPVCSSSFSFLSDRLNLIDIKADSLLMGAFLQKDSILRPTPKTIELRSNQSPLRHHAALEYLTFTSGILEGLQPSEPVQDPATIARIGTYTGASSETNTLVGLLNHTPLTAEGNLKLQPALLVHVEMRNELIALLHPRVKANENALDALWNTLNQVRIMPDKTIEWPPALIQDAELKRKLDTVACNKIVPCVYAEGFYDTCSPGGAMSFQKTLLDLTKSSPVLAHHFGVPLRDKIVSAHVADITHCEESMVRLDSVRESKQTGIAVKCALPSSSRNFRQRFEF